MVAKTLRPDRPRRPGPLGVPLLVAGAALTAAGFAPSAPGATGEDRSWPDPWLLAEWLVALAGLLAAAAFVAGPAGALSPSTLLLAAPGLPLVPLGGLLIAMSPAWVAPPSATAADAVSPAGRSRRPSGSPRAGGGARMIRFEDVSVTYPDAERSASNDVSFEAAEGELVLVIVFYRDRQVDAAGVCQRPRPALHRWPVGRPGHGGGSGHPHLPPARAGGRRRLRQPGTRSPGS